MDASDRDEVIWRAQRKLDQGQFEQDLSELVGFATESQNPDQAPVLKQYLDLAMTPRLQRMGFVCEIHDNPVSGGAPLLVATRIENEVFPTVLCYGHGDVILGQESQWRDGLNPFVLTAEGDRLFGRGSADNKSQHLINLMAMETVIETRGALGFNVKVLIDMAEETGSVGLEEFCRSHRNELMADVLIASDGPRLQADIPTVFMGARGAINFQLRVDLREGAHHSGNWGGLLADPAIILSHAIASITDARGQIAIPEWRPDSLTDTIRAALRQVPMSGTEDVAVDADWGEADLDPVERALGWNSFAVLAMKSGVPEAPVNAIAGHAHATCQLRFVVGTDVDDIISALRRHLDRHGFDAVQLVPAEDGHFPATRLNPDHPWVQHVAGSIERTCRRAPHVVPNLAGSLPNHCFSDILGMPTVWVPHSYRGCNQHAPNEHVLKPLCREALGLMAGIYWDIGAGNAPDPVQSSDQLM